jgi:hypothetical protein
VRAARADRRQQHQTNEANALLRPDRRRAEPRLAGFLFVFNENDFGMVALRANERSLVKARLSWLDLDNAGLGAALTAIWIIDDCR